VKNGSLNTKSFLKEGLWEQYIEVVSMEDFIVTSMSFIFGVLFLCFSRHKESFEKTAIDQGIDTAEKKFRIIKICGYVLIIGSGIYGFLLLLTM